MCRLPTIAPILLSLLMFASAQVRLGIRLLYKGLKSRDMEKKRSTSLNDVKDAIAWFSRLSTSATHRVTSS